MHRPVEPQAEFNSVHSLPAFNQLLLDTLYTNWLGIALINNPKRNRYEVQQALIVVSHHSGCAIWLKKKKKSRGRQRDKRRCRLIRVGAHVKSLNMAASYTQFDLRLDLPTLPLFVHRLPRRRLRLLGGIKAIHPWQRETLTGKVQVFK